MLSADAASLAGMPMAKLAPQTRAELGRILPSFATTTNPIDITAALLTNSRLFGDILPVIAKDPAADAFFIGVPVAGTGYDVEAFARDAGHFAADTGKPLVIAAPQPSVAGQFTARGLITFATEAQAIRALDQFLSHYALMMRIQAAGARSDYGAQPVSGVGDAGTTLNEAESLAVVKAAGVQVVPYRLCHSADECLTAWRAIGGPVAIKGCSRNVPHKSELGLVRLGVNSEPAIAEAWQAIDGIMRDKGIRSEGMIVAAMAKGRREMMIGAHRDPDFGPVVLVGDGGKYVEALGDVRVLLPPFAAVDVDRALRGLRIAPLLDGVRGDPPIDVAAFCEAAVKVGELMRSADNKVTSLDLNPVIVCAVGEGYVV